GGTQIVLFPAIRERVTVWVRTEGRQRKGSARWNHKVAPRFDRRRAVPGRGDDSAVLAESHGGVKLNLLDADKVKKRIGVRLQIVRRANSRVTHNGRAAARLVSR